LRSLAVEAGRKCMQDAGVTPSQIEAFYLGNFAGPSFVGQNHLAPYIAGAMHITGVPCTRFEAACASSGSAFFHAVSAVGAGLYDRGAGRRGGEDDLPDRRPKVTEILAGAGDMMGEGRAGATFAALFAMIARRHMYQYGTTREQTGRRGCQESRQRRQESAGAHAESHHDRTGARRQTHLRIL
jgi:acetyl-CoA C-acetyltransferase